MSEEPSKKSKIDLKARLGKALPQSGPNISHDASTVAPQGEQVPHPTGASKLPVAKGSVPSPLGSPGMSSVPLPPMQMPGVSRTQAPAPALSAQAQTIKIELGDEIHEQRRQASKTAMVTSLVAAVVGMTIGFFAGGWKASSDRQKGAIANVGKLSGQVSSAQVKMKELGERLADAASMLSAKTYPSEFMQWLGQVNIPFGGTYIDGKQVSELSPQLLKSLLTYASGVEELNESKDSLKNLLSLARPNVERVWQQEKAPVFGFSVVIRSEGIKTYAELVSNKEPFALDGKWPSSYMVSRLERGKTVEKKVTRFEPALILARQDDPAFPVDPASMAPYTSQEVMNRMARALRDLRTQIEGDKDNPAGSTGLLLQGDDLESQLVRLAR